MIDCSHILVTGTGTDIGKTIISAMLVKAFKGYYFKPYQSGIIEADDTTEVKKLTKLPDSHFIDPLYRLKEPLSPHAAAALEGITIDPQNFSLPAPKDKPIFIESAGGPLVPLNNNDLFIDTIDPIPTVIVSPNILGTINDTLSTIEVLRQRNFPILGIILNKGPYSTIHEEAIERFGSVPILGQVPILDTLDAASLDIAFSTYIKIQEPICQS